MSKKSSYCLFFIITFSLLLTCIFFNPTTSNNQIITNNSSNEVTVSGINVISPSDLKLLDQDPTNHTISWTLTDTISKEYLGIYSFTNDSVGSNPAGWTITEPAGADVGVIAEKAGHRNVLNLTRYTIDPMAVQIFGSRTPGSGDSLEFWVYGSNDTRLDIDVANTGLGSGSYIWLQLRFNEQKLYNVYNGGSNTDLLSSSLTEETWHHIRVRPTGTNAFQIWLDGVQLGPTSGTFRNPSTYSRIMFYCPTLAGNCYVDAVDYSWVSGYYLNRNTNYDYTWPKDYLGTYSFTNDSVGSNPVGWTITEPAGANVDIVAEQTGHRNVLNLTRYTIDPMAIQIFGSRIPGSGNSLEFWVYGSNGTRLDIDVANTGLGFGSYIWLQLRFNERKFYNVYNGGSNTDLLSSSLTEDTWHHIRVRPTGTNAFQIWLDGIQLGPTSGTFQNPSTYSRIMFYCPTLAGNCYVDAVDYSWASDYYLNRNMDFDYYSNLTSAVFVDGTQKTSWNRWTEQVQVDYKVNGLHLGLGIHNVSLAFNDVNGFWSHDDVSVNVSKSPTVSWEVPLDIKIDIDIGMGGNGKADIPFNFKNTGDTLLMNINFTIALPAGWTAEAYVISINQLAPNESVKVVFKITVPKDHGDFLELIPISVEAYVYELAQEESGTIEVVVSGTKVWDIYIWLVVIVGSVAAAGTTSFYVIRRRRSSSPKLKVGTKSKSATPLKTTIPRDFPDTYAVLSEDINNKINNLKSFTDNDKAILLEYIIQLDEKEALAYLESLEKIMSD